MNVYWTIFLILCVIVVTYFINMIITGPTESDKINVLKATQNTFPYSTVESITDFIKDDAYLNTLKPSMVDFLLRELYHEGYVVPFNKVDSDDVFWKVQRNWDRSLNTSNMNTYVSPF